MELIVAGSPAEAGWWEFEILCAIQRLHGPWLDQVMVFLTGLADHGMVWIVSGLLFLVFSKTRPLGTAMLLAIGFGYITGNLVLKNLFARSRPCWLWREVTLLIPIPMDYSFPSGHTMVSFEGAFCIWRHNRRWGIAALFAAAVIAFSRMYLFVHFPTDILGGIVLGIANGWAGEWAARRLVKNQAVS